MESRDGRHDSNTEAVTGLSGQALIGDPLMNSRTSVCLRVLKEEKGDEAECLVKGLCRGLAEMTIIMYI